MVGSSYEQGSWPIIYLMDFTFARGDEIVTSFAVVMS
jgi:hypothetical protein